MSATEDLSNRIEEAIKLLATGANPNPQYLGYAYGRAGRREEAERFAVFVTVAVTL